MKPKEEANNDQKNVEFYQKSSIKFSYKNMIYMIKSDDEQFIEDLDSSVSIFQDETLIQSSELDKFDIDVLVIYADKLLNCGVLPQRIAQGSSGSYFIKNYDQNNIAVFKPKNEEPYGNLNPKWLKWLHKTCLPCLFGRSCIIPNQGYLSEVGASLVDNFLNLNIVPHTTIAYLSSTAFNYSPIDRSNLATLNLLKKTLPDSIGEKFKTKLPYKVGSFQIFCENYKPASEVVYKFSKKFYESSQGKLFLLEFQKMVVLDYIIRNTDRWIDNWLIKIENDVDLDLKNENGEEWLYVKDGKISLAAIDNGLSFPFKHPDSWRSYPFYWVLLPCAEYPFYDEIIELVLPILTDENKILLLTKVLHSLFKTDEGFSETRFNDQMSVLRGQISNLCDALKDKKTPSQLTTDYCPIYVKTNVTKNTKENTKVSHTKKPFFSSF